MCEAVNRSATFKRHKQHFQSHVVIPRKCLQRKQPYKDTDIAPLIDAQGEIKNYTKQQKRAKSIRKEARQSLEIESAWTTNYQILRRQI